MTFRDMLLLASSTKTRLLSESDSCVVSIMFDDTANQFSGRLVERGQDGRSRSRGVNNPITS